MYKLYKVNETNTLYKDKKLIPYITKKAYQKIGFLICFLLEIYFPCASASAPATISKISVVIAA